MQEIEFEAIARQKEEEIERRRQLIQDEENERNQ
tara:strand:+ start:237 stop:338 length:102 start_codon:yes stop_codon:yes gene_type:complete